MKISLIGMSNVGKSYWSKKLQENGFKYVGIDEQIVVLFRQHRLLQEIL